MRLIDEIEELIPLVYKDAKRAAMIRTYVDRWTKIVLAYPMNWSTSTESRRRGSPLVDKAALDMLGQLDVTLSGRFPTVVRAGDRQELPGILDELSTMLAEADHLPVDARLHLGVVINHVRQVLSEYRVTSDFNLSVAIERLVIAVYQAANAESDAERKSEWKAKVARWTSSASASAVGGLAVVAATPYLQLLPGMGT